MHDIRLIFANHTQILKVSEIVVSVAKNKLDFMPILGPYSPRQAGIA